MLSVPSKVFLLGEYAVLADAPAWVTAVSPRFELRDASGANTRFHPESPAGKLLSKRGMTEIAGSFFDPWESRGGFGGSTAEFAFVAHRAGIRSPVEAWRAYRELSRGENPARRPSGADLIAQWHGGTVEWDPKTEKVMDLSEAICDLPILVFSATHLPNRKTVTHSHLEGLSNASLSFASLVPAFERGRDGLRARDWSEIGHAFSAYADSLAHLGLEAPAVRNERLSLSRQPGVIGAKGCGSLQTDAMLVVVESLEAPETGRLIDFASAECGFRLLSRGLTREPGIREESR